MKRQTSDIIESLFRQNATWFELIKAVRQKYEVSLFAAERLALDNERWRHWCEIRINTDPQCRKLAKSHIRYNGAAALIDQVGTDAQNHPVFRINVGV